MEAIRHLRPHKGLPRWACTVAHYLILTHRKTQSRFSRVITVNTELVELIAEEMTNMADELDGMEQVLKGCFENLPENGAEVADRLLLGGPLSPRDRCRSWDRAMTVSDRRSFGHVWH